MSISCQEHERRGGEEGLSLYCRREEGWRQNNTHFPFPSPLYNPFRLWKKREISGKRGFFLKKVSCPTFTGKLSIIVASPHSPPHTPGIRGFFFNKIQPPLPHLFFYPQRSTFPRQPRFPKKGWIFLKRKWESEVRRRASGIYDAAAVPNRSERMGKGGKLSAGRRNRWWQREEEATTTQLLDSTDPPQKKQTTLTLNSQKKKPT